MVQSILSKGYMLYMDNWYSSPQLFLKLLKYDTNAVRTVKKIKICQKILLWDRKDVCIFTVKHSNANSLDIRKRQKTKDGDVRNILKPSRVFEYNRGMEGVYKYDYNLRASL